MASDYNATWKKGDDCITGAWEYVWDRDAFYVELYEPDPITGRCPSFWCVGDSPNFNGWKLVKEKGCD